MPMMAPQQISSLNIPTPTLQQALSLSDEQTTKVAAIQRRFRAQFGPGGPGGRASGASRVRVVPVSVVPEGKAAAQADSSLATHRNTRQLRASTLC